MRDGGRRLATSAAFPRWSQTATPGCWCTTTPADTESFEAGLAEAVNALVADPERAQRYGRTGRQRCIDEFSWAHIAEQTLEIYRKLAT